MQPIVGPPDPCRTFTRPGHLLTGAAPSSWAWTTGCASGCWSSRTSATINQAVADRLAAEGFDVAQAYDGPAAVAARAECDADLVVLDVMLPGFDGHEVCRRIQADRPVPVLMLTARDDETDLLVGSASAPTTT